MLSTSFVPLNIAENENHVKKGDKDQLTKKDADQTKEKKIHLL